MKRIIFVWLLLCTNSLLFAQNDSTNDSWLSNSGAVSTGEEVTIHKRITFTGIGDFRGLRRDNGNYNLDLFGGDELNSGAAIVLSGDERGGANSVNNGRLQFFTGGDFLTSQAEIKGDFNFTTRWSGGSKTLATLDSSTGRLGIGTGTPSAYLHVQGPLTGYVPGESGLRVKGNYNTYAAIIENNSGGNNAGGLLVETSDGNGLTNALLVRTFVSNNPQVNLRIPNAGTGNKVLLVENGGFVGIGTATPENALEVCGIIRSNEVIVENDWCDFVFHKDYKLPALSEQKSFIENNGHLKNFQSEAEMAGQIHVGDVNKRQQQSIEEIMLYLIQIEERLKVLEEENAFLKAQNSK